MSRAKLLFMLLLFLSSLFIWYNMSRNKKLKFYSTYSNHTVKGAMIDSKFNVWLIFTKVVDKSPLMYNFQHLVTNLLNTSSVPLKLNIIVDNASQILAAREIEEQSHPYNITLHYSFYDIQDVARSIKDIVEVMTPHFSSRPGTYYSDALFYISLGLYRVAPLDQERAVMVDCDILFKDDILKLFKQFDSFSDKHLFGLAPELSPVYRHILYSYKQKHNTTFGDFYRSNIIRNGTHPFGYQGYNSGVILFNFKELRTSEEYRLLLQKESVERMVAKYSFRGHLGDQDYYTLLGYEYPHLIKTIPCAFNRQLCTWWKTRGGYNKLFDDYFACKHETVILHGNCNTKLEM